MKILATDLDRTLLPNGQWPADPNAIELFNRLTQIDDLLVVYVTGRSLELTEEAVLEFGVRAPDILCGDVGTTIRRLSEGGWMDDPGWGGHVRRQSPRWNAMDVRAALASLSSLTRQEERHQNQFKESYDLNHEEREVILNEVRARVEGLFDEVIVYSYDSAAGKGLLDLLPASATKRTAVEYVAEAAGVPKGEVVFCGDSGNDILPLTAGFRGVVVRNADEQLVAHLREAMAGHPELEVYFAQGGFRGLSGYYTSGVLEGASHYGLL